MKIFVLEGSLHYESQVLGVYSSRSKAEKEEALFISNNPDNNGTHIYEMELDQ